MSRLRQHAVDETFATTEDTFRRAVRLFHRKHGGEFCDLLSLAGLAFMRAYDTYDPEVGDFVSWVRLCIHNDLKHAWQKEQHRRKLLRQVGRPDAVLSQARARRVFFLPELSADGTVAVAVALAGCDCSTPGETARRRVIAALRLLGWDGVRIVRAFNEVRENL